jgi:murein DD-endopeptidase MepM/ murein hydrolase activator NlpD
MRRYSRPPSLLRPVPLIAAGIVIGALIMWGQPLMGWMAALRSVALAPAAGENVTPTGDPALSPVDASATPELAADGFPIKARQHVLKYTIQAGDTLIGIAEKFHLDPDTIFWANSETLKDNIHLIQIGVNLYILPVNGVYHYSDGKLTFEQIAAQYGVSSEDILSSEYNQLAGDSAGDLVPAGMKIIVPGGRRSYTSWQAPIRTGSAGGFANPEGTVHPGSCREHYIGSGGSAFTNPLGDLAYRVTTGFAPWHPGVDLAANLSTPIHAAETGVVVFAGWHRDGYGELVIIDHGNGWTTYYGHLSSRFVGCGDQVVQGAVIGLMGMTGNATGVHLHFEIRLKDVPQNPYKFIQFVDSREGG